MVISEDTLWMIGAGLLVFTVSAVLISYFVGAQAEYKNWIAYTDEEVCIDGRQVISNRKLSLDYVPRAYVIAKLEQLMRDIDV